MDADGRGYSKVSQHGCEHVKSVIESLEIPGNLNDEHLHLPVAEMTIQYNAIKDHKRLR